MKTLKLKLFSLINSNQNKIPSESTINKEVKKTVKQYKLTLKKLEDYDKGKIQKPKDLARSSSVRTYLQQF